MLDQGWDWQGAWHVCLREALRYSRSSHEAEDAAQNALLRAWRHHDRLRSDGSRTDWLRRIARNESLRARARRIAVPADPHEDATASITADDGDTTLAIARLDIARALAALDAEDRALLLLRYGADLTQPAAAKALGIPEGTAKVRLHRLRARMAQDLQGHEPM